MAYLHNAVNLADFRDLLGVPVSTNGRLFTGADKGAMVDFLKSRLTAQPGHASGDILMPLGSRPVEAATQGRRARIRDRPQFQLD